MTPIKRLSVFVILVLVGTAYTVEAYLDSFEPPAGPVVCASSGCEPLDSWDRARACHSPETFARAQAQGWRGSCSFSEKVTAEG